MRSGNNINVLEVKERAAYERLSIPLALYQLVNDKVITLVVSEGLCEMIGKDRESLTRHFNNDMFGIVHPEDVEMLAQIGYRFAHDKGVYDVIYRMKLYGKEEYRLVHTVGKIQYTVSGVRTAFFTYFDVTEVNKKIIDNSSEINNPKVDFFNENLGPMVVIAQKDQRLLYYNQAVCRMIPPKVNFDSGITYQQFFYPDFPEGIKGLRDAVNCGPRVVKEPYTNRDLEISVIASTWNKERAYVIYFYELLSSGEKEREMELELARNNAVEANRHLQAAVLKEREKVEAILVQTILAVSKTLDAKDPYTCRHSERVAKYASAIAQKLNWSDKRINNIYHISLVHDIGKIGIPDALLMKPTSLTANEYEIIKGHVTIGSNILHDFTAIEKIYEGILYHHERYDGCGYVFGLKEQEIPIEARIIGIADAVDAMYSTRPYRERQDVEYIIKELVDGSGKQFDPELVDIMLELIQTGLLELDPDNI